MKSVAEHDKSRRDDVDDGTPPYVSVVYDSMKCDLAGPSFRLGAPGSERYQRTIEIALGRLLRTVFIFLTPAVERVV